MHAYFQGKYPSSITSIQTHIVFLLPIFRVENLLQQFDDFLSEDTNIERAQQPHPFSCLPPLLLSSTFFLFT